MEKQKPPLIDPTFSERDIRSIYAHEKKELGSASWAQKLARKIGYSVGTMLFVVLNAVFFSAWMLVNVFTAFKFDPYPFDGMTLFISFEALFLTSLVLISQNSSDKQNESRHDLQIQINLLSEDEATEMIKVIAEIGRRLNIPEEQLAPMLAFAISTDAGEILAKIDKIESELDLK